MIPTNFERLIRCLAVEHGDESQAPHGWTLNHAGDTWSCAYLTVIKRERWWHAIHRDEIIGHSIYALDAMEGADLAYIGIYPHTLSQPQK